MHTSASRYDTPSCFSSIIDYRFENFKIGFGPLSLVYKQESAIGMAADVGTLQRLPKIVGNDSLVRELAFTARNMGADEAHKFGLVSHVAPDEDALSKQALETAQRISGLSPLAVQGTKYHLNYARDSTIQDSLDHQVCSCFVSEMLCRDMLCTL